MPKARPRYQRGAFYHFFNRGAHRVFNSYSKAYNKMYAHSGTLF
jgi:hypothetical protein